MGYLGNGLTITGTQNSKRIVVDATPNQTISTVTGGYLTGQLDVYRNGVKLVDTQDYTAADGSSVTFLNAVSEGDELEFVVFENFDVANALSKSGGSLNGDLVVTGIATFNSDVSIGGTLTYEDVTNIDSVGIITARSFVSIADSIVHTGDENTSIRFPAADTFTVETGGSEALRVDSSQRLLVGATSSVNTDFGFSPSIQVAGNGAPAAISVGRYVNGTGEPHFTLQKSRNGTIGGQTLVQNNDSVGTISFEGSDGTSFQSTARITAEIDGATGTADVPGRLIFATTPDGAGVPTERLRITSAGDVGIGTASPTSFGPTLQVAGTDPALLLQDNATAVDYLGVNVASGAVNTWFDDAAALTINTATGLSGSGLSEKVRITSAGDVGIGSAVPATKLNVIGDARIEGFSNAKIQIKRTGNTVANGSIEFLGSDDSFGWGLIANNDAGGSNFNIKEGSNSRLYIKSGNVGIATDNPGALLSIQGGESATPRFAIQNTTASTNDFTITQYEDANGVYSMLGQNVKLDNSGNNSILDSSFRTAALQLDARNHGSVTIFTGDTNAVSERLRIDSNGRVFIDTTADRPIEMPFGNSLNSAQPGKLVIEDSGAGYLNMIIARENQSNAYGPAISLVKSRGTSDGSYTVVQSGDNLGTVQFGGADGSADRVGAAIVSQVDNTPGSDDMPGRLMFATTADGSGHPTERLRIDSNGNFIFKNGALVENGFHDDGGGITGDYNHDLGTYGNVHYAATNAAGSFTYNLRINSSTTLNSVMAEGDTLSFTLISANDNTARYMTAFKIDGTTITPEWSGGSGPSAATGSGFDVYSFTCMKIGDASFKVFASFTNHN